MALYRKYRSRDFDQLVGQDHVADSLNNALKQKRISHAYLFAGPRGVGKTSAARILARRINQLPPETGDHLDIIEIDGASNRRIDEVRDLREKVHITPTSAQYKVYIIDEVHMLTTEAFNALLKTLEEPPEHVVFILATTEVHKLPETIVSRTQHYSFNPIAADQMIKQLVTIAKAEKIKIQPEALAIIAEASSGSLRDGISILDQVANLTDKEIGASQVAELLGMASQAAVTELATLIAAHQPAETLKQLEKLVSAGISAGQLTKQLLNLWQQLVRMHLGLAKPHGEAQQHLLEATEPSQLRQNIQKLAQIPNNLRYHEIALEAGLLELASAGDRAAPAKSSAKASVSPLVSEEPMVEPLARAPTKKAAAKDAAKFSEDLWLKALTQLKSTNNSLYALLRSSHPEATNGKLQIAFRFQFHRRRLEEKANVKLLQQALKDVTGQDWQIEAVLVEGSKPTGQPESDNDSVSSVLEVLGGEVVG
jgi:DNA polymerase III subunit gamma/tau